jgi:glutaredoxin
MEIIVYSSPGCFYCDQFRLLMERGSLEYTEYKIETQEQQKKFREQYPDAIGYPYVLIDGTAIGGLVEAAKFLVQKGLISAKK